MTSYTLKNISADLFEKIKKSAEINHRSINSQILTLLEEALNGGRVDVDETIQRARALREKTAHYVLTDEILDAAKREGRK